MINVCFPQNVLTFSKKKKKKKAKQTTENRKFKSGNVD